MPTTSNPLPNYSLNIMSSVAKPVFLAELFDLFLDNLHDDPIAIGACSLVCKSWMIRARCHLFRTVDLHLGNIAAFLKLFQTPTTSTLIPAIRHLRYTYPIASRSGYSPRIYLAAYASCGAVRVQSSFTEILRRLPPLPHVVSVTLKNTTLETATAGYMGTVFPV